jgi:hypothetical protein
MIDGATFWRITYGCSLVNFFDRVAAIKTAPALSFWCFLAYILKELRMWDDFGFDRNLYDTHPVGGNDLGQRLLVGRAVELKSIKNRIRNINSVVSVEGPNGVGKTSLVLVAGYQLECETEKLGKNSLILIQDPFQFTAEDSAIDFKRKVYASIASQFIKNEAIYRKRLDLQFNLNPLQAWLENPMFVQGSATFAGFGGGAGRSPNESSGFDLHGFFSVVDRLLGAAFQADGAVICILDNLEILNTSQAARQKLETLRDDLFSKHGIKWVVCGARGIVRSVATSPRLQGRLQEPMLIEPLNKGSIEELIKSRVKEFGTNPDAVPPVGQRSFTDIFEILNDNLRDALKFSGDFSLWLFDKGNYQPDNDELHALFEIWLAEQSDKYAENLNVPPRAWKLFDKICEQGGSVSPSDYQEFDFNSSQNMRGQVAKLEAADLVTSELDETDHRRKTITIMAKGWLLRHHRNGYI